MAGTEEFFQAAFDAAPEPIVVFDDDGAFVYANQAATELYSTSREEIRTRSVGHFSSDDDQPKVRAWMQELRERGGIQGHHRLRDGTGRTRAFTFKSRAGFVPGHNISVLHEFRAGRLPLSPREREIIQLMATGLTGTTMSKQLDISPDTVRTHVRNAMEKLGARTRPHAVALAAAYGEIDVSGD